jgi:signal transduction histidine kinase
LHQKKPF